MGYAGHEDIIGHRRMSKVLTRFNLFYDAKHTAKLMKLFSTDKGLPTKDEPKFQVDLFLEFLISVNDYLLAIPPAPHMNPFSKNLPPSVQWDVLFRWLFPIAVLSKMGLFFAFLSTYPEGDTFVL